MPASSIDLVQLLVDGRMHEGWTSYSIDSDLMVASDGWSVQLRANGIAVPVEVVEGASLQIRLGGATVLSGRIDELNHAVNRSGQRLDINGRDGAAVLLDCSAPVFSGEQLSLEQVVAKIVRPLGVTRVRIDAERQLLRDRVSTEPGDTAWDALRRAAEANGLWPWFDPDGTLVVGGPDYTTAPVDRLVMRFDGKDTNVESLAVRRSIVDRYSEVTVLGQAHAVGDRPGRNNIRAVVKDTGVPFYRPRVMVDHDAVNEEIARARGRKVISDARVSSFGVAATVRGHRTASGVLWQPGQRVSVVSEPHGLDGTYFLMQRRFTCSREAGQLTQMVLREDGAWVLDAHPSHRKHRRGKNAVPGKIIDIPAPA